MGQEQVPQALLFGLFPQAIEPVGYLPAVVLVQGKLFPLMLARINMLLHKCFHTRIQLHHPFRQFKTHRCRSSLYDPE